MSSTPTRRRRLARLERPLLGAGLALLAAHLLDLALSGPETSPAAVALIVVLPVAAWVAAPRVTRPTRVLLAGVTGLLAAGFGASGHLIHAVADGPSWTDVTGLGMVAGGVALLGGAAAAAAA